MKNETEKTATHNSLVLTLNPGFIPPKTDKATRGKIKRSLEIRDKTWHLAQFKLMGASSNLQSIHQRLERKR